MNAGELFAAMPVAFFWACFTCFAVISMDSPLMAKNNLTSSLLVSSMVAVFILILAGPILLVRYMKNHSGFWTKTNMKLEQLATEKQGKRHTLSKVLTVTNAHLF
jgi:hypothetical protein